MKPVTLPGGKILSIMDPYCVVDFDDFYFGQTSAKKQTVCPVWGETLDDSVEDSQCMQLTLFHSSTIPPDNFVAHVLINVAELEQLCEEGHGEHQVCTLLASLAAGNSAWQYGCQVRSRGEGKHYVMCDFILLPQNTSFWGPHSLFVPGVPCLSAMQCLLLVSMLDTPLYCAMQLIFVLLWLLCCAFPCSMVWTQMAVYDSEFNSKSTGQVNCFLPLYSHPPVY